MYFQRKMEVSESVKSHISLKDVLVEGEEPIFQSLKNKFILTNKSVVSFSKKTGGSYKYVKIPLEMISSFEIHRRIKWIFLILFIAALLAWLIGDFVYDNPRFRVFIIKTVVMSILFVVTFKKALKISSKGGSSVKVLLKDLKDKDAYELIREIEALKEKRIEQLKGII